MEEDQILTREVSKMGLLLRKSPYLDDWYTVEWAEHDHKQWLEPLGPNSMALRDSSRISDADVEGTRADMVRIAKAIREGRAYEARRCAVEVEGDAVYLWSPRNSQVRGMVNLAAAQNLAAQIEALPAPSALPETTE